MADCFGLLRLRVAAVADALRISDDPHPVRHHRRTRSTSHTYACVQPLRRIHAGYGGELYPGRYRRRVLGASDQLGAAKSMGARVRCIGIRPAGAIDVRFL